MYFGRLNSATRIHRHDNGFTYIGLLIAVALVGVMLVSVATFWHQALQRENERQLLFVGNQFRQAIAAYYENSPGPVKQFPKKLEDLIADQRTPLSDVTCARFIMIL
jgi:type II secretory pathway pseudopilin PulG